jgi:putative intracellular protease/amidase
MAFRRLMAALTLLVLACGALPAASADAPPPRKKVAILVFDGVQMIDFAAPLEVFAGPFEVFTVGPTREPVATAQGLRVVPTYAITDAPQAEILVVPGGGRERPDAKGPLERAEPIWGQPEVLAWIRERAAKAEIVLSVCNGAFTLARLGLLDGLEATTTAGLIPLLAQASPKTKVRDDRRFVDNGKIVTAAGLSAGIDASLHVVERVLGRGTAQLYALGIEYPWDPEGGWTRAALADRYMLFRFDGIPDADWTSVSREGDRDRWTSRWRLRSGSTPGGVRRLLEPALERGVTWGGPTAVRWERAAAVDPEAPESLWKFRDERGRPWTGRLRVDPMPGAKDRFDVSLTVERADARTAARVD